MLHFIGQLSHQWIVLDTYAIHAAAKAAERAAVITLAGTGDIAQDLVGGTAADPIRMPT